MQWDFENITNRTCIEPSTGVADTIEGNFETAPGVVGKGLRLDGLTTRVLRNAGVLKNPDQEFTIEAWVSLGEYPWNWCPVITTESNEVKGYRLMIGPLGQVSLEAAIGEQWICCTSAQETMPLRKWMHLVGVCRAGREMSLYVNGELAASLPISGSVIYPAKTQGILGMVAAPGKPSDIIRTWATVAAYYGLDGIVDEIKVFDSALTAGQIKQRYSGVTVMMPDTPVRRLPATVRSPCPIR